MSIVHGKKALKSSQPTINNKDLSESERRMRRQLEAKLLKQRALIIVLNFWIFVITITMDMS